MKTVILTEELTDIVQSFAEDNPNVEIHIDIPKLNAQVMVDGYLSEMIMGILDNAVTHNPNDEKKIWVTVSKEDAGLEITIGDNGNGLTDKQKKWILDMERRFGGVGIHISKQIAEKYSGRLEVADRVPGNPAEGAVFKVWLPRVDR